MHFPPKIRSFSLQNLIRSFGQFNKKCLFNEADHFTSILTTSMEVSRFDRITFLLNNSSPSVLDSEFLS